MLHIFPLVLREPLAIYANVLHVEMHLPSHNQHFPFHQKNIGYFLVKPRHFQSMLAGSSSIISQSFCRRYSLQKKVHTIDKVPSWDSCISMYKDLPYKNKIVRQVTLDKMLNKMHPKKFIFQNGSPFPLILSKLGVLWTHWVGGKNLVTLRK